MLETSGLAGICDLLGPAFDRPLATKAEGLAPYRYSIVIENSIHSTYMSEKIMDALALGTAPLYWGSPYAKTVFGEGVLPFSTPEELRAMLVPHDGASSSQVSESTGALSQPLQAVLSIPSYDALLARGIQQRSLDLARKFVPPERWLWDNVLSCAYEWHAAHPEVCKLYGT
jgi:hypothetical protein